MSATTARSVRVPRRAEKQGVSYQSTERAGWKRRTSKTMTSPLDAR